MHGFCKDLANPALNAFVASRFERCDKKQKMKAALWLLKEPAIRIRTSLQRNRKQRIINIGFSRCLATRRPHDFPPAIGVAIYHWFPNTSTTPAMRCP